MNRTERWGVITGRVLFVAAVAVTWELVSRLGLVYSDVLPPLSKVLVVLWQLIGNHRFRAELGVTAIEVISAFAIVGPLGIGIGFAIGESRRLERRFAPIIHLLMAVPKAVFLPAFILLLGIGFVEKVAFAVVLAVFLVVPSGVAAVHSVPPGFILAARSFGATRSQIYSRIYLPAMAPLIVGGLRLALIFSVQGIIFAEMYAATGGIGRDILNWGEAFQMSYLLAAVLLVVTLIVVLNESLQACETYSRSRFSLKAER